MGTTIGLSAYRFQMKERTHGANWWVFEHNGPTDGYGEVKRYLNTRHRRLHRLGTVNADGEYSDQRALLLSRLIHNDDRRMLAGLFLKGEAGAVREIRDFDDPEAAPSYRTSVREGILTPLYFRFHIEDARPYGVLILQTAGIDGMKGFLDTDMRAYFLNEAGQTRTIRIKQLVDAQVLDAFARQGQLQDVVLINSGSSVASRDAMEQYSVGGDQLGDEGDKLALHVHRKSGWAANVLGSIREALQLGNDPRGLIEAPGLGEIDDVKVEIKHGGRTQTFSLLNPDDSPIRYSVRNPAFGEDGHPSWDSVHAAADEVWDNIRQIIG